MSAGFLRILAAVFACIAVLLAVAGWKLGQNAADNSVPLLPSSEPAPSAVYSALVASADLFPGDKPTAMNTTAASFASPVGGSFASMEALPDMPLVRPVPRGKIITTEDFEIGLNLARTLKAGKRGVAVSIDELIGVGGHLNPGDRVDVLYSAAIPTDNRNHGARRIFSGLTVLSVGQNFAGLPENPAQETARGSQSAARTVVLEIDESYAPVLLLAENTGRLRLSLIGSEEVLELAQEPLTASQLEDLFGPFYYLSDVVHDESYISTQMTEASAEANTRREVQMYIGGQVNSVQFPVNQ